MNMFSNDNLKKLPKLEAAEEATQAFWNYSKAVFQDGAIPKKYKELMAVAVGLTTQCGYCIDFHRDSARKEGATDEELAEVTHIAAAIRAGGAITHGTHLF